VIIVVVLRRVCTIKSRVEKTKTKGRVRCDERFYRAMHYIAKRGLAIARRLSVRLSVCDVGGSRLVLPFWYQLTRVVPEQNPVSHKTVVV